MRMGPLRLCMFSHRSHLIFGNKVPKLRGVRRILFCTSFVHWHVILGGDDAAKEDRNYFHNTDRTATCDYLRSHKVEIELQFLFLSNKI